MFMTSRFTYLLFITASLDPSNLPLHYVHVTVTVYHVQSRGELCLRVGEQLFGFRKPFILFYPPQPWGHIYCSALSSYLLLILVDLLNVDW